MQTPEQKIKELKQKVRHLEREKLVLENCLTRSEDKALILDKVIGLSEKAYLISVRKTSYPINSKHPQRSKETGNLSLWIGRVNRQYYYRSFWLKESKQAKAEQVVDLVREVRDQMPRAR